MGRRIIKKSKHYEKKSKTKKHKILILFLIFLFIILAFYFCNTKQVDVLTSNNASKEGLFSNSDTQKVINGKSIVGAEHISVTNFSIVYENNLTYITFELTNNNEQNQDIFNFKFSLLDENGVTLTDFQVNSENIISPHTTKKFLLVSSVDYATYCKDYLITLE